ncbi:DUF4276 family protein [Pannonibacter tanglangensis]|uniref:DUF4276 family protein n=1 Tax=Pannonibacter tanglangensis TaxID=2750084 RepID=A0ABW9ZCE7_9HYPH|nr:DUF4276 family protein [Pannonibacter sp. XCT-34]NBN62495.1 DUF4276 family protein [Pannonibacter sp. XCT-34]
MKVNHLEVLVEEPSMAALLFELLPRVINEDVTFSIFTYNGKSDLLKKLPDRLLGYSSWLPENFGIVVLVDNDDDDCKALKATLEDHFARAGIPTKQSPNGTLFSGLTRIAIKELEAWYFGNWPAVNRSYPKVPLSTATKARFRNSDEIQGGTWEAFERICKDNGLFLSGLRKVEAARAIGKEIDISENKSPSFQAFIDGIRMLTSQ